MTLAIVFQRRSPFLEQYVISYPRLYLSLALMFELLVSSPCHVREQPHLTFARRH